MSTEIVSWPHWLPRVLWMRRICPSCTCTAFKPSPVRSYDTLLGMFFLRPVQCTWCWRRFYCFSFRVEA